MKNVIACLCMILFFGFESAQETPSQKKQSTDTTHTKSKHPTKTQKSSTTKKGDTINRRRTDKKGKTVKSGNVNKTPQSQDSIRTRP